MFTNDYIMRMIEQLVWGIAKIMGLRRENKTEEASALLTDTLRHFFGLNDRTVEELPWESLMNVVNLGGAPDPERCALLAQLVKEKADLMRMRGAPGADALYVKAINILATAVLDDDAQLNEANVRTMDEAITAAAGGLPEVTGLLLFRYYEAAGKYGKAEDTLYDLLQSTGSRKDIVDSGREFYKRLMQLDAKALAEGNLPKNEVLEGYNKLINMN